MSPEAPRPATPIPGDDPTPQTKAPPNPSGRQANGRFARGNRGGPGNPFARRVAELRCAFIGAVLPEDLQQISRRLITMAAMGDLAAAKLVLGYSLGRIPEPVDPDTLDQQECRMYQQNISCTDIGEVVQHRPPADMAAGILRASEIANAERGHQVAQEIREELRLEQEQQGDMGPDDRRDGTEDDDVQGNPACTVAADSAERSADTNREKRRFTGARRQSTASSVHGGSEANDAALGRPSRNRPIGAAASGVASAPRVQPEAPPSPNGGNREPVAAPPPSPNG